MITSWSIAPISDKSNNYVHIANGDTHLFGCISLEDDHGGLERHGERQMYELAKVADQDIHGIANLGSRAGLDDSTHRGIGVEVQKLLYLQVMRNCGSTHGSEPE